MTKPKRKIEHPSQGKRELPANEVLRKGIRKQHLANLCFAVFVIIPLLLALIYFFGNKFIYATESCTVTGTEIKEYDSNSGGIVSHPQVLYVYSDNCPSIAFQSSPSGVDSLAQLGSKLQSGQTYEFQIGVFRWGAAGSTEGDWPGVGVELTPTGK